MESLSLTKDGDSNFSAKLKPGTINGFYKAVVEFSEVGMTHALELKFTPSLKREVSKDDLNDTEPLAKQSNNWFFELVPDKNIYVLSGNNIHIKVLDGDEIHLNLKVSNIAKNRNNLPQIKSIKLLIEYQNPDIKF